MCVKSSVSLFHAVVLPLNDGNVDFSSYCSQGLCLFTSPLNLTSVCVCAILRFTRDLSYEWHPRSTAYGVWVNGGPVSTSFGKCGVSIRVLVLR